MQILRQIQHFVDLKAQIFSWHAQRFVDLEAQILWQAQRFVEQTSWHAQHFVDVQVQISWQMQHKMSCGYFLLQNGVFAASQIFFAALLVPTNCFSFSGAYAGIIFSCSLRPLFFICFFSFCVGLVSLVCSRAASCVSCLVCLVCLFRLFLVSVRCFAGQTVTLPWQRKKPSAAAKKNKWTH